MKIDILVLIIILTVFIPKVGFSRDIAASPKDIEVYNAFNTDNFDAFAKGLDLGGDPMEWFGNDRSGWVMCASTEEGRENYLRLLLEKEYDSNFRQLDVASRISTPLLCAISYGNIVAVKSLVTNGADPTLKHCHQCSTDVDTSSVWMAVISSKYEIADWLFLNADLSESKVKALVDLLEKYPFPTSSPENIYRLGLIKNIKAAGFDVSISQ